MKTTWSRFFFYSILVVSLATAFFSCKKSGAPTQSLYVTGSFVWIYNNRTIVTSYDSAYEYPSNPPLNRYSIVASTRGGTIFQVGPKFYFVLSSLNVGSYTIQPSTSAPNTLQFIDDSGNNLIGISGTVDITSRINTLITGSFSITLLDPLGNNTLLTGYFTDMSIVH